MFIVFDLFDHVWYHLIEKINIQTHISYRVHFGFRTIDI